ncbi:MAG: hypothetical protein K0R57_2092 [Paenibacillaceae bacterium]|jgi:hypothetical protein|nr:hypothetical protein [Paenibacillaceae bacterium]
MQSAAWFVNFIRDEVNKAQPSAFNLAIVTSIAPLRIRLSGVELGSPFLSASETLAAGLSGEFPTVVPGDTVLVAVLPNQQRYVALCKVVNM